MGKPGKLEWFSNDIVTADEFVERTKLELDAFSANMKNLEAEEKTMFEWLYTFGFWNEALEFRDEFPKYFEEFQ